MGIKGLWKILSAGGRRTQLESLEGMRVAVDMSIWMMALQSAMKDSQGKPLPDAHLIGLFARCCKLLYFRAKPVFVFEGPAPVLKLKTQKKRVVALQRTEQRKTTQVLTKFIQQNPQYSSNKRSRSMMTAPSTTSTSPKEKQEEKQAQTPKQEQQENEETAVVFGEQSANAREEDKEVAELQRKKAQIIEDRARDVRRSVSDFHQNNINTSTPIRGETLRANEFSIEQTRLLLERNDISRAISAALKKIQETKNNDNNNSNNNNSQTNQPILSDPNVTFSLTKDSSANSNPLILQSPQESIRDSVLQQSQLVNPQQQNQHTIIMDPNVLLQLQEQTKQEQTRNKNFEEYRNPPSPDITRSENGEINEYQGRNSTTTLIINEPPVLQLPPLRQQTEVVESAAAAAPSPVSSVEVEYSNNLNPELMEVFRSSFENENHDVLAPIPVIVNSTPTTSSQQILIQQTEQQRIQEENEIAEAIRRSLEDTQHQENLLRPQQKQQQQLSQISENPKHEAFVSNNEDGDTVVVIPIKKTPEKQQQLPQIHRNGPSTSNFIDLTKSDEFTEQFLEENSGNEHDASLIESLSQTQTQTQPQMQSPQPQIQPENEFRVQIPNQIAEECKKLLALFGLPYITAQSEAEAECAHLNELGLVDAVISDDSDIFLFGAKTVFRNLFRQDKFLEKYTLDLIAEETGLTHDDLINFALLVGGDYKNGIPGIGLTHALEIIDNLCDLSNLRAWCKDHPKQLYRKLDIPKDFPSQEVINAYKNPKVSNSTEPFLFGRANIDELRRFAIQRFKWSIEKANRQLAPIVMFNSSVHKPVASTITLDRFFAMVKITESLIPTKLTQMQISILESHKQKRKAQKDKKESNK